MFYRKHAQLHIKLSNNLPSWRLWYSWTETPTPYTRTKGICSFLSSDTRTTIRAPTLHTSCSDRHSLYLQIGPVYLSGSFCLMWVTHPRCARCTRVDKLARVSGMCRGAVDRLVPVRTYRCEAWWRLKGSKGAPGLKMTSTPGCTKSETNTINRDNDCAWRDRAFSSLCYTLCQIIVTSPLERTGYFVLMLMLKSKVSPLTRDRFQL